MLNVILSPAKKLDLTTDVSLEKTQPVFIKQAKKVQSELKEQSPKDLMELMKLSQKLGDLNWERNQNWKSKGHIAAGYAFDGEAYKGLGLKSMSEEQLHVAQKKLYILSGLYGLLKPLDAIDAYRLEMGARFSVEGSTNLYDFWKETITKQLNKELGTGILVNVASNEYFKAIDKKKLKAKVITCHFKDDKDGKLKTIMVYAKKARGMMARYIIENKVNNIEDLKKFDYEGYALDANLSTEEELVFTR